MSDERTVEVPDQSPLEDRATFSILRWPGNTLFVLMLVAPTDLQPIKAGLLLLVSAMLAASVYAGRGGTIHRCVIGWVAIFILSGLFFMMRGAVRGEPGAFAVGTVYVLWPAVFLFLLSGISGPRGIDRLFRLLVAGTVLGSAYAISVVLHEVGFLPDRFFVQLSENQAIGLHDGYVELRLGVLGTLVFSVPFLIAALFAWGGLRRPVVRRPWLWAALLMSLAVVLVSGRRALILVVLLAPLFSIPFVLFLPHVERRPIVRTMLRVGAGVVVVPVVAFVVIADQIGIRSDAVWEMFAEGFSAGGTESMSVRSNQLREMLASWVEHPFLGSGHGAFLPEHIRDLDRPWSYELSYGALLFQTGILGVLVYGGLIAWIFAMMVSIIRRGGQQALVMIPVAVGFTSFLMANATNPYLSKFDFIWVLFLPLALINVWLQGQDRARPAVHADLARPALIDELAPAPARVPR